MVFCVVLPFEIISMAAVRVEKKRFEECVGKGVSFFFVRTEHIHCPVCDRSAKKQQSPLKSRFNYPDQYRKESVNKNRINLPSYLIPTDNPASRRNPIRTQFTLLKPLLPQHIFSPSNRNPQRS